MKNDCLHINRKNTFSYKMPVNTDFIVVKCTDCGWVRYETIDNITKGKSESKWKEPREPLNNNNKSKN